MHSTKVGEIGEVMHLAKSGRLFIKLNYAVAGLRAGELLEDVSKFDLKDTHARDLSMAWGQALLGAAKLLFKKQREHSDLNEGVMEYLLG